MARPAARPGSSRPRAAALRYRPEAPFQDAAPRLVAKGQGLLAERILELAKQHGVSITKDPDLLAALEPLDLDRLIPPDLFQAVAVLLAALYRANRQASGASS
ncbi:MAG: EscU/YscU/HrcU family type III secretion system export apparatus switch protein [Holophagaceae bacterium]|jgi:flagellar biosynthesis protein|uniref:EscU/YscU/HrcU family type III secretion system export apparatus switch protein n=1 Tax=Candidatus Geothrix odensensis TaxID=2954440 RepID=A0A936K4U4_9BACT|nr:EscU/YscU/HrcU family type III secretion system export apparatus switch protein [Holophagaceae bacterium]MBK8571353.1 EscU/YscU/HrcU family type III secretion system export apparatus switch protein [Candidatus Geothrix odensensis]MBK8790878.1 EscU/YscU/HrcU family type III secretion system export apparatus switch protein [Holophagaceae bacterium]